MTAEEFFTRWQASFPGAIPVIHYFPTDFDHRWLRIPSLPNGARFADDAAGEEIILERQNKIISDMIGPGSPFLLVTGEFYQDGARELNTVRNVRALSSYSFTPLHPIDMHRFRPEEYEAGQEFRPMYTGQTWHPHAFDELLLEIANDTIWAFFLSMDHHTLVSPFPGHVDCLLPDEETRNHFRVTYEAWL